MVLVKLLSRPVYVWHAALENMVFWKFVGV